MTYYNTNNYSDLLTTRMNEGPSFLFDLWLSLSWGIFMGCTHKGGRLGSLFNLWIHSCEGYSFSESFG